MIKLKNLTNFLNETLDLKSVAHDASNNGLQIQGCIDVSKAVFGVDFSLEIVNHAIEHKAQFIFVHHGQSWGSSLKYITGNNYTRIKPLMEHGISLYAVHLPLDKHPEYGHNAIMAKMINLQNVRPFFEYDGVDIGYMGRLNEGLCFEDLSTRIHNELNGYVNKNSKPCLCKLDTLSSAGADNSSGKKLDRVGIVSGGGGHDGVLSAISEGLDCLITGEFNHSSFFFAKEAGLSVISPGHYLTETPGVLRMMQLVRDQFEGIEVEFVDIPTGL